MLLGALQIPCQASCQVKNAWPALTIKHTEAQENEDEDLEFCCGGPIWASHQRNGKTFNSLRPIFTIASDPAKGKRSAYFFYPLFRRHESTHDISWSGVIAKSRYPKNPNDVEKRRIFMIFDYRKEGQEGKASRSLFPISGRIDHFLGNDTVSWTLFPAWIKTQSNNESRYTVLWPFIRWQKGENGEAAGGGSIWPFWGHTWHAEQYDNRYYLWPLIYHHKNQLKEDTPWVKYGFLPFYTYEHSAALESKTWIWPFFGYTDRLETNYHETRYLWPFFVQAKGDTSLVNRWAPFYTHSIQNDSDKKWYLWPFVKKKSWDQKQLHIEQKQFLYFVVWTHRQTSLDPEKPFNAHKIHVWPFFTHWNSGQGCKQFQMLSPLEPFFQHNEIIRELYSPLFAFYRYYEKSPEHYGTSFLFNLITYEKSPEEKSFTLGPVLSIKKGEKISSFKILGGLLGYEQQESKKTLKLLWFSV